MEGEYNHMGYVVGEFKLYFSYPKENYPLIIFRHIFVHFVLYLMRTYSTYYSIAFMLPSVGVTSFTPLISAGPLIKTARTTLDNYLFDVA